MQLKDRKIEVTSQDLAMFRDLHLGTSDLASRISELLWLDIYTWEIAYGISVRETLGTIQALEQSEATSVVKPGTQFKYPPLKGLWHKHVFSARFIPKNIFSALGKGGLRKIVTEVVGTDGSPFTLEKIAELKNRVVHESFEKRATAKELTGEWIIYLQHEAKNYYLCCSTHNDGDQFIYDRIVQHCPRDFPELPTWLKNEQNS